MTKQRIIAIAKVIPILIPAYEGIKQMQAWRSGTSIAILSVCTILATAGAKGVAQASQPVPSPGVATGKLRAGAARVDITPSNLTNLNPFGGTWSGVHDPIYARILVLDNGDTKAAIIATDLIEVGDTTEVRERIQRELGIRAMAHLTCVGASVAGAGVAEVRAVIEDSGCVGWVYSAWLWWE